MADRATLAARRATRGVEANARLTGTTAALLLVLLAAEGATVVSVRSLLTAHVVLGMVAIPPVLLKIASTGYRFVRYYTGAPAYRRKGPPPVLLRLLGPVVVLLTGVLFGTGVGLVFSGTGVRPTLLRLHQVSFVVWFAAMTVHVLGHLLETARLAPRDFYWRTRGQVRGAGLRQWAVAASLVLGVILAALTVGHVSQYLAG
jgi:hypothetical protein